MKYQVVWEPTETVDSGCHRLLRRHLLLAVCAALVGSPAQAWFGPSEQDPYLLSNATAPAVGWHWADARVGLQTANVATRDGYSLGDAVFKPRPFDYLQAEFARQVQTHPAQASLQKRLNGQTLQLLESEVSVGLWMRFTEHQQGNWDMVRVRLVIEFEGGRYEAVDTHPFKSREKPSPVSAPMEAVVLSLVNQLHLFAAGPPEVPDNRGEPEPAQPTDADVLRLMSPAVN